ncbi:unnamed protein product [Amoebophrya sp. A25]|nr:unnamed protein product [Amoebophrya sp. A25]|eukprot:GSA25T00025094001.1
MLVSFRAREWYLFGFSEWNHEVFGFGASAVQLLCVLALYSPAVVQSLWCAPEYLWFAAWIVIGVHAILSLHEVIRSRLSLGSDGQLWAECSGGRRQRELLDAAVFVAGTIFVAIGLGFSVFQQGKQVEGDALGHHREQHDPHLQGDRVVLGDASTSIEDLQGLGIGYPKELYSSSSSAIKNNMLPFPTSASGVAFAVFGFFLLAAGIFSNALSVAWLGTPGKLGIDDQMAVLLLALKFCSTYCFSVGVVIDFFLATTLKLNYKEDHHHGDRQAASFSGTGTVRPGSSFTSAGNQIAMIEPATESPLLREDHRTLIKKSILIFDAAGVIQVRPTTQLGTHLLLCGAACQCIAQAFGLAFTGMKSREAEIRRSVLRQRQNGFPEASVVEEDVIEEQPPRVIASRDSSAQPTSRNSTGTGGALPLVTEAGGIERRSSTGRELRPGAGERRSSIEV